MGQRSVEIINMKRKGTSESSAIDTQVYICENEEGNDDEYKKKKIIRDSVTHRDIGSR